MRRREPLALRPSTVARRSIASRKRKQVVHIADLRDDQGYRDGNPRMSRWSRSPARARILVVPMLKDDELVGAIVIYRQEVRPFTDKQIELVRTSPRRPSSPSRTRGCSTSCASARTI